MVETFVNDIRWDKNEIIRNKDSGHPLLVLHVYKGMCTLVVDLENRNPLSPMYALLPKEYDHYAVDRDMVCEESGDDVTNWEYIEPIDDQIDELTP